MVTIRETKQRPEVLQNPMKTHRINSYLLFLVIVALLGASFNLPTSSEAQSSATSSIRFETVAPGIEHAQFTRTKATKEAGSGPWLINALRIDLKKAGIQVVRAMDEAVGLETVSSLVMRHNAIAGINGGYFRTTGTYRGESLGSLVLDGRLLSDSHNDRAAVGLLKNDELVFGRLRIRAEISSRRLVKAVDGVNRPVAENELVVFTPDFHRTTLTSPGGLEVEVRRGRVINIRDGHGSSQIPVAGLVLSARGAARQWALKNLRRSMPITFSWKFGPMDSAPVSIWRDANQIIGGGPQLISGGAISITNVEETIAPAFISDRHPRTAIAKLGSGALLLITVDGRQPGVSVGMSLPGLAELLREFNATEAINLDGGGSTTMVLQNRIVNRPSDQSGERPVSDAILVFSSAK